MSTKLIKMKSIDPMTLLHGIFGDSFCLASDSLVPVLVWPEHFGCNKNYQTLQEALKILNDLSGPYWPSLLGPCCFGQFSALKQTNIFLIARTDIVYRAATPTEVSNDFDHFGEQVMGARLLDEQELKSTGSILNFMDELYIYTGPPRFCNSTLTARIVSRTGLPSDYELEAFKKEIDADYEQSENSSFQRYIVLTTEKAGSSSTKIKIQQFDTDNGFDPNNFQYLGIVKAIEEQEELWFYPEGNTDKGMDFSKNFWTKLF